MADSFKIEIEGLKEMVEKYGSDRIVVGVGRGLDAWALMLVDALSNYPKARKKKMVDVYGRTFKTDKQRRGFFAKLKDGQITVPYKRPGTLGRS